MIRVLLVDDHAVLRAGFRTILQASSDIVVAGEAATGQEAVDAARSVKPDVICMDVQMPGMDGLEATRLIVADPAVTAAVIVVTTFDRDDYLFAALDAGASGFLLKNAGADELVAAVRIVAGGDALLAPEVTRRVIERFAAASGAGPVAADEPDDRAASAAWPVADVAHRTRAGGAADAGPGAQQRRDRPRALHRGGDGQDARLERPAEARSARPRARRRARPPARARLTRSGPRPRSVDRICRFVTQHPTNRVHRSERPPTRWAHSAVTRL